MWTWIAGAGAVAALVSVWVAHERRWRNRLRDQSLRLADLRTQRHLALVEQQSKQQALLDSMLEGVLVLDTEGRVEHMNPALLRLLGLSSECRGKAVADVVPLPGIAALATRAVQQGRITDHEVDLPGPPPRAFQVSAVALRDPDRILAGTLFVFHDLTQHKRLEEQRREFVANVSHELRTPLSLIKGYTETLLGGAMDQRETMVRFLQTIDRHADRLTFLIEDLLTISRLESGQVIMNMQPTTLRDVVEAVINDLRHKALDRSVILRDDVPENIRVHADGDRLQQVVLNLVDNAIKYGKAGGQVVIGARAAQEDIVEAWVSDDGQGIPPEARDRIFERFYRVDRARARDQGGTGLGLSIVKHIIHAHGGEVRVNSEVGKGTTFSFTLARVNDEAAP
ncbi:MAG: ATP-binding protein [Verrucomicrobiota bacterium]|jgi:two-component system phosphate regulon sensor histidine kinase PhoR